MGILFLFAGLTVGNFSYQFFGKKNYETAFERSFFQAVALAAVFFIG